MRSTGEATETAGSFGSPPPGGWILVTRNQDDFVNLTVEFYQTGEPHCGVLILTPRAPE